MAGNQTPRQLIESGTMLVLKKASEGINILSARRPTKKDSAWLRAHQFVGTDAYRHGLPNVRLADLDGLIADRCDGMLPGGANLTWVLTSDQAERLIVLDEERSAAAKSKVDAERKADEDLRRELADKAAATGTDQVLRRWISSCCLDNLEDCSFDACVEYIRANGTTYISHSHCH